MKFLSITFIALLAISCQRTSNQTWEDVKTASRYMNQGIGSLWGNEPTDSHVLTSEEDFMGPDDDEFIPLDDGDLNPSSSSRKARTKTPPKSLAREQPSKEGNFTPANSKLSDTFRTIHFGTDDHVLYEKFDLVTVARIANYLKKHSFTTLMIEGHCDQRASADYNLALATRRANHVRVLLLKQGVARNQIMTSSCGKEKPVAFGNTQNDHALNRRVEFKIYDKK